MSLMITVSVRQGIELSTLGCNHDACNQCWEATFEQGSETTRLTVEPVAEHDLFSSAGGMRRRSVSVQKDMFVIWCVSTGGCGSVQSARVRYGSCFHCQKVGVTQTEPH